MALKKSKTQNRITGEYWVLNQKNANRFSHTDCNVTLELYTNAADRATDKAAGVWQPLPVSVSFNFNWF